MNTKLALMQTMMAAGLAESMMSDTSSIGWGGTDKATLNRAPRSSKKKSKSKMQKQSRKKNR